MPAVAYPELENELFCNQYYLRHLCDTDRFPDWPIENHVCTVQYIVEQRIDDIRSQNKSSQYSPMK
jgi:DnaJ family protein C protein 13